MNVTSRNSLSNPCLVCQLAARTGLQLQDSGAPGPPCSLATKMAMLAGYAPYQVSSAPPPPQLNYLVNIRADWGAGRMGAFSDKDATDLLFFYLVFSSFMNKWSQFGARLWWVSRGLKVLVLTVSFSFLLVFRSEWLLYISSWAELEGVLLSKHEAHQAYSFFKDLCFLLLILEYASSRNLNGFLHLVLQIFVEIPPR